MADKILIDAHYKGEIRVVVISDDGSINHFETEYVDKKAIKGNIYLAKIVRIETSLQAAFVDYGSDKNGFLSFSEIRSECYDKEAVQAIQKPEELKQCKIQDVMKLDQMIVVQAIKEKRGNKCAAFSTFFSLPGKYCVLASQGSGKSCGISKKICEQEKERLKLLASSLKLPEGFNVIIRTAGENRTQQEIKRDFGYLTRLWSDIQKKVKIAIVPALIHEEGNIIKRTIRDLYQRTKDEIIVHGEFAYKEAKTFMKAFTPSHCWKIVLYNNDCPIFCKYDIEKKIGRILDTTVPLPSGGSIVLNTTEALTAIDVNSGKMKKEKDIEGTAIKTNLEAAVEITKQIKLRDIAGLIVVDFIDMSDQTAVTKVEKKFKECMKDDYSTTQIGKISPFGLLEISRQRSRRSLSDSAFITCKHCRGAGRVLSEEIVGMSVVRQIEGFFAENGAKSVRVEVASGIDSFLLNKKRRFLIEMEDKYSIDIEVCKNSSLRHAECNIFVKEFSSAVVESVAPRRGLIDCKSTFTFEKSAKNEIDSPVRIMRGGWLRRIFGTILCQG